MSALDKLSEAAAKIQEVKRQATETAVAILKPALKEFLAENPEIKTIAWSQYTPYFNDGEECIFSVNSPSFSTAKLDTHPDSYDGDEEVVSFEAYSNNKYNEYVSSAAYKACYDLGELLESLSDELKDVFGDHCQVIVNEDGIFVEQYDHD